MTDVPADPTGAGPEPVEPSEPPVVRRSNYSPPPPGAEPPRFDDDALAEAMAAEVRPYTQPITLPKPPTTAPTPTPTTMAPLPPPNTPTTTPPPVAEVAEPPAAPPPPAPVEALTTPPLAVESWNGLPLTPDAPASPGIPAVADDAQGEAQEQVQARDQAHDPAQDELLRSLGGASTLEAIERLENELRLLSNGEPPTLDLSSSQPITVVDDPATAGVEGSAGGSERSEPEPAVAPEPESAEPESAEPESAVAPEPEPAEPESADTGPEPALDHPAPGHFFPAAFEPIAPPAPGADAPATPDPAAEVPAGDTPVVDGPTGSRPVSEAAVSETPSAMPPLLPEVDESLIDPAAAAELTAAASAAPTAWSSSEPVDGAWDIAIPPPSDGTPSPQTPDAGPTPVPFSTEPPVGPEAPDWLDAPPPSYEPPELIEPPAFFPGAAAPSVPAAAPSVPVPVPAPPAPVAPPPAPGRAEEPSLADALAGLPKPLPTEQPRLQDRAELPPPPGYENIPIMWGDVASATPPVAPDLIFPPAPAPPPLSEATAEPTATPTAVPLAMPTAVSAAMPPATEAPALDHDEDDVIDEIDRVSGTGAIPVSRTGTVDPLSPPSEPIATIRLTGDQPAIVDEKPQLPSAFEVESAGPEPTALDMRAGRAARLFWLWFAANSSVLSLGLGAVLMGTGMSLRQAIVATLAGVAISFLPLGLGTLAGKWSGQPTMIVSRATFGHAGNILPALLAVLTRVLWGGVLLWLLATAVAQVLVGAGLDAGLGATIWQLVGLVVGFVIATLIAVFGYGFVAKLQLVLSILSALLIVGAAVLTFQHLNFAVALTVPDGSWILVISGAALVFSVVGLAWVHSSSDLARYQRPASYGGTSMLWATFGATLPPFLLIAWGAMLAASDAKLAKALSSNPLAAIATLLPAWYPAPLLAAAGLGLLSGAVLTMYSGGFAIQALGVRARRSFTTFISAILVLAVAAALIFVVTDFASLLRDLVITVAVPVAAWAGIFASEMMIRTRRFHAESLLAPGGVYPQVRWLNFLALIVISAIGLGLVTSGIPGLGWEGFLYGLLGVGAHDPLVSSDLGVFVALLLGILVPLIGGVPAIRKQERPLPA
jgi:purine-cytosine permease-like protein